MLGQDRPGKNSAKCVIRSSEIPGLRQISIDKPNDCVMNNGARSFGAPTHPRVSIDTTAGDVWQAPARRLTKKTFGRLHIENRQQKFSIHLRWQKIDHFQF